MHRKLLVALLLVAAVVANLAHAADDQLVQIGQWSCQCTWLGGNTCSTVKFAKPFGAAPDLSIAFNGFGPTGAAVSAGSVTSRGFLPSLQGGCTMAAPHGSFQGNWIGVGSELISGSVVPSYIVLTVVYAPPGANDGKSKSNVEYSASSTTGTTTTATQSFKVSNTLSFDGSAGILGNGIGIGTQFEFSRSVTDTQSLDIKKTILSKIGVGGPSHDGVDHDEDEIWLLLNPIVNLAVSPSTAEWMLSSDNSKNAVQWLQVGQLNGNPKYSISTGLAAQLASAGITSAEFQKILKDDPLACTDWSQCGSSPNISPSTIPDRFNLINCQIPYEPPGSSTGSAAPVVSWQQTNSSTSTINHSVTDEYSVGLTIKQTGDYLGFAMETLKDTTNWTWTNKSEGSTQTGTSDLL
jgi:hypothetical protein